MIKVMKSKQVENKNISCSNMLHVANIIDDTRVHFVCENEQKNYEQSNGHTLSNPKIKGNGSLPKMVGGRKNKEKRGYELGGVWRGRLPTVSGQRERERKREQRRRELYTIVCTLYRIRKEHKVLEPGRRRPSQ